MKVWLTKDEAELVREGLNMKCNYIETGDPIISGADADAMGVKHVKAKGLTHEQMELVCSIRKLINKITLYEIRNNL